MKLGKLFYSCALGVLLIDQVSKVFARQALSEGRVVSVIAGVFDLRLSYNPGAAFGVMPSMAPMFILVGLVAVYAIVRLRHAVGTSRPLAAGLGLLLGGALGNLADRLISKEHVVTDFLDVHIGVHSWPTFNVADAAIVIGALSVLFHVYIIEKRRQEN